MVGRKLLRFALLGSIFPLFGLQISPWFGDIYRFYWDSRYSYSYFDRLADSDQNVPSSNQVFTNSLEVSCAPQWSIDVDLELAQTPRQNFGYRSFAFQIRYLLLDDILGDLVTCTTSLSFRLPSGISLGDISSPHHGNIDFQGMFSLGKEFEITSYTKMRIWGSFLAGISNNTASPWVGGHGVFAVNYEGYSKFFVILDGRHGYGRNTTVDVRSFRGYGNVRYRFLDLTLMYSYKTDYWGSFSVAYKRRLLAGRAPSQIDQVFVNYSLPFSF